MLQKQPSPFHQVNSTTASPAFSNTPQCLTTVQKSPTNFSSLQLLHTHDDVEHNIPASLIQDTSADR